MSNGSPHGGGPHGRRRYPHRRPPPKSERAGRGSSAHLRRLRHLREALRRELERPEPAPLSSLDLEAEPEDAPISPRSPAPIDAEDDLPELMVYRDTGCHVAPACLSCPLPRCIFDEPVSQSLARRDRRIRALYRQGWSNGRIAAHFRISTAHVRRIRGRREQP
ncbi:MAG: hypothetical protein ACYDCQ_15095 [Dehalococcoidia bacterium]